MDPLTPARELAFAGPCADDLRAAVRGLPGISLRQGTVPTPSARLPDAFVVDARTSQGVDAVRAVRKVDLFVPVLAIIDEDDVDGALAALKVGATEYATAPIDRDELSSVLARALARARAAQASRAGLRDEQGRYTALVGDSPVMQRLVAQLEGLEDVDAPTVLITGESGVGKDLVARAIHEHGRRSSRPFVEVDCAAIPEHLVESHLFGHERGAFTDARETKRGLFELARGGTVFLDEIGELPLATQAKLLRALETRRFKRVGGTADLPLDAALISATNRDLRKASSEGRFRGDLFYRLNVIEIRIPPLRERAEDIPPLVEHFVRQLNQALRRRYEGVDRVALRALVAYPWPGNVRELRNVIERAMILHRDDDRIQLGHLPSELVDSVAREGTSQNTRAADLYELPAGGVDLGRLEAAYVRQALERCGGNQTHAAAMLGMTRFALRHRAEKYGLVSLISTRRGRPKSR